MNDAAIQTVQDSLSRKVQHVSIVIALLVEGSAA